jgi:hypothetical protein
MCSVGILGRCYHAAYLYYRRNDHVRVAERGMLFLCPMTISVAFICRTV